MWFYFDTEVKASASGSLPDPSAINYIGIWIYPASGSKVTLKIDKILIGTEEQISNVLDPGGTTTDATTAAASTTDSSVPNAENTNM